MNSINVQKLAKFSLIALFSVTVSGCGLSTFTQRETDPFLRDYLLNQTEPVAIMITDSSRRLIYEFNNTNSQNPILCSDASPDTSIAASGTVTGNLDIVITDGSANGNGKLNGQRVVNTVTSPLLRRSQGLQWGRDNSATECMLFGMKLITKEEYLKRLDNIRDKSADMILKEIDKGLGNLTVGGSTNTPPANDNAKKGN